MSKEIADIFSFRKQIVTNKPRHSIIVDSREKNSMVLANLIEKGANTEIKKLEVGDYQIGKIIIERKTRSDFYNSIKSGHLKEQVKSLKTQDHPLLILEEDKNKFCEINQNVIKGMKLSLNIHHRIPIINSTCEKETAEILIKISEKEYKTTPTNPRKIPKSIQEQRRFILEAFPGIGPKASQKLLEKFTNLRDIFNAEQKEIEILTNAKVAEEINRLLN